MHLGAGGGSFRARAGAGAAAAAAGEFMQLTQSVHKFYSRLHIKRLHSLHKVYAKFMQSLCKVYERLHIKVYAVYSKLMQFTHSLRIVYA